MTTGGRTRGGRRAVSILLALFVSATPVSAASAYNAFASVIDPAGVSELYGGTATIDEFVVIDGALAARVSFAGTSLADASHTVGPVAMTVTSLLIVTLGTCEEAIGGPVVYVWLDPDPVPVPGTANTIDVSLDRWIKGVAAEVPNQGDARLCRLWRTWTREGNARALANALNASVPYLTP